MPETSQNVYTPELTLGDIAPAPYSADVQSVPGALSAAGAELTLTQPAAAAAPAPAEDEGLSMSKLTPEEQEQVKKFLPQIDISNSNLVLQYGAAAQNKISQFSEGVLKAVRTKDSGETGKMLTDLVAQIQGFDATADDKGGIFGIFNNAKRQFDKMLTQYNKVETNVDAIVGSLEQNKRQLTKDIAMYDVMYQSNLNYFKELTLYIVAGMEKLKEINEVTLPALQQAAAQGGDEIAMQKYTDTRNLAVRFEKKLHDLKLSRMISIQMAPQLRLIQNNDAELVDKIQSSIVNSIPLWKNQIVIALGLQNAKSALAAQQKVTDMTNQLLVKNSEMLKQGSIDIARETERSIVSIDTLKKTNENLISTINEVLAIQQDGHQQRMSAEAELARIEGELKQALISTAKPPAAVN